MPVLTLTAADGTSRTLQLATGSLVVGRDPTCDLVLDDPRISRRHALLQTSGAEVTVRDLKSHAGTFVNGKKLERTWRIGGADRIQIGAFVLEIGGAREGVPGSSEVSVVEGGPVRPEGVFTDAFTQNPILDRLRQLGALSDAAETTGVDLAPAPRFDPVSLLVQITERLHGTESVQAYLEEVLALACDGIGADTGAVVTLEPDGRLEVVASRQGAGDALRISRTVVKTAIEARGAVATADASRDERFEDQESVHLMGLRSVLCVPLHHESESVPCALYLTRDVDPFAHETQLLAAAIAHLAALGIERARLREVAARAQQVRSLLSRFHAPDVIDDIVARGAEGADSVRPRLEQATATVMFCDLVGFTRLCERLSPQKVGELLNVFYGTMTEIIFELGGTVDKYIGDCVMALFGVPLTREDDARRAAEAALRMRRRFTELRDRRCPWMDEPLDMRIGINTGPVMAGTVGSDLRLEYTALGDTVNVAQRLESAAQPGQILIGPMTREQIGDAFRVDALSARNLKGRTAPVRIFELLGRAARPAA
jgi:adenylate cyclase